MKPDYKWVALGLLWVAFFLQQGTRQIYGPLVGSIQTSTGASDVQIGLVSTVFTLVYGLTIHLPDLPRTSSAASGWWRSASRSSRSAS